MASFGGSVAYGVSLACSTGNGPLISFRRDERTICIGTSKLCFYDSAVPAFIDMISNIHTPYYNLVQTKRNGRAGAVV
jgi:hypothetical protein